MKKVAPKGMRHSARPWREKLRPDLAPKICDDPRGRGRMLVPTPMLVAGAIAKIRRGRLLTVPELRNELAAKAGADFACPLCTGIFINIVAGAAEDDVAAGRKPLAPYWRVIRDDGTLSEKPPPGPARQAHWLRAEGHKMKRRGKTWRVDGFSRESSPGKSTPRRA
ncbi:hypothetical protein AYO41_05185 [Verrucomicrobia bacterium SCGC AG-212-E04]|nr:hypothetical protein AYO41_05185 [Verrucomicrobia bacterium SCGC AG-212-E04]